MENVKEYIEREALKSFIEDKKELLKCINGDEMALQAFEYFINKIPEIPTADVVEVVRCKECLHKNEWANDSSYPSYNFCKHSGLWNLTDNHFCSYGEGKEK